jgi:hypothetical protein
MSKDSSDAGEAVQRRTQARTAWLLVASGGLFFVGWMVGQAAEQEIWLRHYSGGATLFQLWC